MNQIARINPKLARRMEVRYGQQLRKIAGYIDTLVKGFDVNNPSQYPLMVSALNEYANTLHHWAQNTAARILTDVATRDEKTWLLYAKDLSRGMRDQIRNTDMGAVYQQLLNEQVSLIKSLPLNAATRIQDLSTRAITEGGRASEISSLIMATGQVTKARASTIARTEISRAAALFTQVRATGLGSEGYIWRTSSDSDVRDSHKALNGTFHKWDEPPTIVEKNPKTGKVYSSMMGHAGCLPNCRCYSDPVIPED